MSKIELIEKVRKVDIKIIEVNRDQGFEIMLILTSHKEYLIQELDKLGAISNEEMAKYLLSEDWTFTPKFN